MRLSSVVCELSSTVDAQPANLACPHADPRYPGTAAPVVPAVCLSYRALRCPGTTDVAIEKVAQP
jgi:hypothetical protein